MKRMPYLDDKDLRASLTAEYVDMMDTKYLRRRWREAKATYHELNALTYSIKQLLISPFGILTRIAQEYENVINGVADEERRVEIRQGLESIFNYDYYRDKKISPFFKQHAEDLELYTCYYCDMAYINIFSYKDKGSGTRKQQVTFDLDHVIEKTNCPILALSLFNFVPSCPICNERIKHDKRLAGSARLLKKLSPSSEGYRFDEKVKIELMPKGDIVRPFQKNADSYTLEFDCHKDKDYRRLVEFMLLEERYNCHKAEALRIKDLQTKYPMSNIHNIAEMLMVTDEEVKEDIFGLKFNKEEHRCFGKLKRDMML